jgi:hypothetical protein
MLAASLAYLGRLDEAHRAVNALLQAYPDATISKYKEMAPNSIQDFIDRVSAGLRLAGMPE